MSLSINAPSSNIMNRDGLLLANNTFHVPGGTVNIRGEHPEPVDLTLHEFVAASVIASLLLM
jgi:hypothetical protein